MSGLTTYSERYLICGLTFPAQSMDELHLLQQIALALVLAAPSSALDSSPDVSTIRAAVAAVIAIQEAAGCFNKGLFLGLAGCCFTLFTIFTRNALSND